MKKHSFGFTLMLGAISAVSSLGIDMGLPALPAIEQRFALLPGRGSLTLSVFLAGFALTPLFGGPLSDRFGRRPVLLTALLVFAAAALTSALTPGFHLLLLTRLLQGSAAGVCVSLPLAIIRDSLQGSAARNSMSQVTTALGVVPVLAPITGSWVLALPFGSWRAIYATQAILALVLFVVVLITFTETLPTHKRQVLPARHLALNYRLLLHEDIFLVHAFVYALAFACLFAYVSASPLVLMDRMHLAQHRYTFFFAATAGSQMFGAFLSGVFTRRRLGASTLIRRGLLLLGASGTAALLLQVAGLHVPALARPLAILFPTMLCLFCFGFISPSLTLGALEPIPHVAGAGSGALRSLQMVTGSAASAFLAWICARPHIDPAVAMTAAMAATALAAMGLYLFTSPRFRYLPTASDPNFTPDQLQNR